MNGEKNNTERLVKAASIALAWLEVVEKQSQCRDTQTGAMGLVPMIRDALGPLK